MERWGLWLFSAAGLMAASAYATPNQAADRIYLQCTRDSLPPGGPEYIIDPNRKTLSAALFPSEEGLPLLEDDVHYRALVEVNGARLLDVSINKFTLRYTFMSKGLVNHSETGQCQVLRRKI